MMGFWLFFPIGNSIGIIIPQFVAQEMKIRKGSYLKMTYYGNKINLPTGIIRSSLASNYHTLSKGAARISPNSPVAITSCRGSEQLLDQVLGGGVHLVGTQREGRILALEQLGDDACLTL